MQADRSFGLYREFLTLKINAPTNENNFISLMKEFHSIKQSQLGMLTVSLIPLTTDNMMKHLIPVLGKDQDFI